MECIDKISRIDLGQMANGHANRVRPHLWVRQQLLMIARMMRCVGLVNKASPMRKLPAFTDSNTLESPNGTGAKG